MNPFRIDAPSVDHLAGFDEEGFISFEDAMRDGFRDALIDEVLARGPVREFLSGADRDRLADPTRYFERPWNDRGPFSDALIDAPLITALLERTVGRDYHFCHSAMNLALPGAGRQPLHQDHHHWKHDNPVNLAERGRYYIQVLYYPNGFTRSDRSLCVVPGSHRIDPTPEVTPERLLSGELDEEAGCRLELVQLELPPGSFVYLNARMFHGVDPKPPASPQPYRIFLIDIFKQAGPPHRFTQEIPQEWMARANPHRRRLFAREPYTEGCWLRQERAW